MENERNMSNKGYGNAFITYMTMSSAVRLKIKEIGKAEADFIKGYHRVMAAVVFTLVHFMQFPMAASAQADIFPETGMVEAVYENYEGSETSALIEAVTQDNVHYSFVEDDFGKMPWHENEIVSLIICGCCDNVVSFRKTGYISEMEARNWVKPDIPVIMVGTVAGIEYNINGFKRAFAIDINGVNERYYVIYSEDIKPGQDYLIAVYRSGDKELIERAYAEIDV